MKFFNLLKKRGKPVIVFVPGVNWSSKGAFEKLSEELDGFDFVFHDTGSWFEKDFISLQDSAKKLSDAVNGLKNKSVVLIGWSYGALVINRALKNINKDVKRIFFINSVFDYKSIVSKKDYLNSLLKLDETSKFVIGLKNFVTFERGKVLVKKNIVRHFKEYFDNDDVLNIVSNKVVFITSSNDLQVPVSLVRKASMKHGGKFYTLPGNHFSLLEHPVELSLIIKKEI